VAVLALVEISWILLADGAEMPVLDVDVWQT
jgi:hypothetical protein